MANNEKYFGQHIMVERKAMEQKFFKSEFCLVRIHQNIFNNGANNAPRLNSIIVFLAQEANVVEEKAY